MDRRLFSPNLDLDLVKVHLISSKKTFMSSFTKGFGLEMPLWLLVVGGAI